MDKNGTSSPSEGVLKTHLQHRLRLKVKIWRILLGMTLITASCGILLTVIGTFSTEFTIEEVSYTTEISYNRGVVNRDLLFDNVSILPDDHEIITISAFLIRPTNPKSTLLPGIVFQHGMVLNKEINLHNAIELACAGFVVLAPDLPGHGNSGGLWDLGMIEMQSLWSGVEYLAQLEGVDPDKISLVGHSNGGIASTRAGIFDKTPFGTGGKIKAVVAIFCISDLNQTVQGWIGQDTIDDPDWGIIISTFAGCRDGIITSEDNLRRSVIHFINGSGNNVPNYYLQTGDIDQLTFPKMQYEIFAKASDGYYTVEELEAIYKKTPEFHVDNLDAPSVSFSLGNARKLSILEGQDHLQEVLRGENAQMWVDWLVLSLGLNPNNHETRMQRGVNVDALYIVRFTGWFCLIAAMILGILTLAWPMSRRFFPRQKDPDMLLKKINDESNKEFVLADYFDKIDYIGDVKTFVKSWRTKLGYLTFITISLILGIIVAWQIDNVGYLLRFWILNQFIRQYTWAGIFLFGACFFMYIAYKMGDKHTKQVNLAKIGLSWRGFKQSVKFVSVSIGIPVLLYNIFAWPLLVPQFYPRPLDAGVYRDVFIVFLSIFLFYFSLEVISKTQLFEIPYEYPTWKGYVQEVIVNGTLIWLMWIVAYLVGGLFMNEHLKWLIVQNNFGAFMLLTVNGIMIGIQGIMAYLSAFFYQRTKNIFSVVLFQTVIVVFVITGKLVFIFSVV